MEKPIHSQHFNILTNARITTKGVPINTLAVNESTPLVSIVTINFNGAATLSHTIESVLALKYPFVEYILIDGGSNDDSLNIIEKYLPYLSYAHTGKDNGISDAFNLGIQQAKGKWIGLINADDWLEPDALEHISPLFLKADIIYGDMQYWNANLPDYIYQAKHELLPKEMTMNHPATFVKEEIYKAIGGFQITYRYAMDYDFLLRALQAGIKFHYCPQTLANMRLAGVSDTAWPKAYKEVREIKIANGISKYDAFSYFYLQCLRTYVSRTVQKLGLKGLLAWYRKNFSLIPKKQ